MTGVNAVVLLGHLTRDPELRSTPNGAAVAQFGLGVNRRWRDPQGALQESACFVEIVAWGRQAETVAAHLTKGRAVVVEGRLELDRWETEAGERRSRLKVVAQRVTFLGRNGAGETPAEPADGAEAPVPAWVMEEA
jgi:single-strand DNA-binding protein